MHNRRRKKKAVFVIGTPDPDAAKDGDALTKETYDWFDKVTDDLMLDAELVFVSTDRADAGKNKSKIGIKRLREAQPQVLYEIDAIEPDFVMCFGPVASACVFGKGNLTEGELLRKAHNVGDHAVYVTHSLEAARFQPGYRDWQELDLLVATSGRLDTEWGEYTVLLPGTEDWDKCPDEIAAGYSFGFDLETYPGLDPHHPDARIRMAVLSDKVGRAWVVQATESGQLPNWVRNIVESPVIKKVGSNIKFDCNWLYHTLGWTPRCCIDTAVQEHVLFPDNPKKDLKSLTFKYVSKLGDYSRDQRALVEERGGWENVRDEEMWDYCGADGEASIGVYKRQRENAPAGLPVVSAMHLMNHLYQVLCVIERNGMRYDPVINKRLIAAYSVKMSVLAKEIRDDLGPINLQSPTQLTNALKRVVPDINLSKREFKAAFSMDDGEEASTSRDILEREQDKHRVIPKLLEWRRLATRYNTFLVGVRDKHGKLKAHRHHYIYPRYRADVVDTYRLSSQAPNGQNIPRKDKDPELSVKRQFIPRYDYLVEADQSQIEIRIAAWLSGDEKMLTAIESGEDIHTSMAAIMLDKPISQVTDEERTSCKTRTFLILYGGGAARLAKSLGITKRKAQKLIDQYFAAFPQLKVYIDKVREDVMRTGQVETFFGFTRKFNKPEHWDSKEGFRIQRQAFNTLVQSTAACVTYIAMLSLQEEIVNRGLHTMMVGQVHDSVLLDVPESEIKTVRDITVKAFEEAGERARFFAPSAKPITVPLKCDIEFGTNWGSMRPLKKEK